MEKQIEALITAEEYIDNLKNGITMAVDFIQEGQEQRGCNIISSISEGIDWLMQVLSLTSEYHKGKIRSDNISEKLLEIVEALENEDYILISDLLNYEIIPILDAIQQQIKEVISLC